MGRTVTVDETINPREDMLQLLNKVKVILTSRRFWASVCTLTGAAVIAWIWLQDTNGGRTIFLHNADEVVVINELSSVEADFKAQGDGLAFFAQDYRVLVVGKEEFLNLPSKKVGMLGITAEGFAYSYTDPEELPIFQKISKVSHQYGDLRVTISRDWHATIALSAAVVLLVFACIRIILGW